jgi:hypothetical protein
MTTEEKLAALVENPLYKSLSKAQQIFIHKYIETDGDKIKAAFATSASLASVHSARNKAYEFLRRPAINALLRTFGGSCHPEPLVTHKELVRMTSTRLRGEDVSNAEFIRLAEMLQTLRGPSFTAAKPAKKKKASIEDQVLAAEKNR